VALYVQLAVWVYMYMFGSIWHDLYTCDTYKWRSYVYVIYMNVTYIWLKAFTWLIHMWHIHMKVTYMFVKTCKMTLTYVKHIRECYIYICVTCICDIYMCVTYLCVKTCNTTHIYVCHISQDAFANVILTYVTRLQTRPVSTRKHNNMYFVSGYSSWVKTVRVWIHVVITCANAPCLYAQIYLNIFREWIQFASQYMLLLLLKSRHITPTKYMWHMYMRVTYVRMETCDLNICDTTTYVTHITLENAQCFHETTRNERWGAGVEYHFQEFNEPYAPTRITFENARNVFMKQRVIPPQRGGGLGSRPKKCTGRDWGMGSSTI